MELKITQEKVLEAASKCAMAKNILSVMFPEAFINDDKPFHKESVTYKDYAQAMSFRFKDRHDLIVCYKKCQGYNGFVLSSDYDWAIQKQEGTSYTILIPTAK